MDRHTKIIRKQAIDTILLCNKLSQPSRKKMKRIASKAVRQDLQRSTDAD